MSAAKPLSREEQEEWVRNAVPHSPMRAWYATVRAAEAEAAGLRAALEWYADGDEDGGMFARRTLAAHPSPGGEA